MKAIWICPVIGACFSLIGCSEPIVSKAAIPPGVSTTELAYHRTEFLDCAAAVYRLEPKFADRLRGDGLIAIKFAGALAWKMTPVPDDMSKETANLDTTWHCLEGSAYRDLFQAVAFHGGGYYAQTPEGGTDILVPESGLLLIGGYE